MKTRIIAFISMCFSLQGLAVPFISTDPVSLGMGTAGTAGGKLSSGPFYNPAILSFGATDRDDFIFSLQFGAIVADQDETYKTITDLTDDDQVEEFENDLDTIETESSNLDSLITSLVSDAAALNAGNDYDDTPIATAQSFQTSAANLANSVNTTNTALTSLDSKSTIVLNSFEELDKNQVNAMLGLGLSTLFPSKKISVGISINTRAFLSGKLFVTSEDLDLLRSYLAGTRAYTDQVALASDASSTLSTSLDCRASAPNSCSSAQATTVTADRATLNSEGNSLANFNYGGSSTAAEDGDTILFQNGQLTNAATDPQLTSRLRAIGVGIGEFGITLSRSFKIQGDEYHIGVTPKYQMISIFDYTYNLESSEDFEFEDVQDTEESYAAINVDVGAMRSFGFNDEFVLGLTIRDLVPNEFESKENFKVRMDPAVRAGAAYLKSWYRLALDLDVTRNQPAGNESRTQYLAVGGEVDFGDIFHLRAGYRTNLAQSGENQVSLGLGFTPFFDLSVLTNPANLRRELGVAMRFGFGF